MFTSRHNGFLISVEVASRSPGSPSRCALVKVSAAEEDAPLFTIFATVQFKLDKDAEAYGVEMGKRWIDARLRSDLSPFERLSTQARAIPFFPPIFSSLRNNLFQALNRFRASRNSL